MDPWLTILLTVLVIALIAYVFIWLIDQVGLPAPMNMIAKAVVVVLAIVALVERTGLLA